MGRQTQKGRRIRTKPNTRRIKRGGGNPTQGDKLMDMLHSNSSGPTKFSNDQIAKAFDKVEEDDLYHSILRKKKTLSASERKAMFAEANRHQEDPSRLTRLPECKFGAKCIRKNPVHKLAHKTRLYHPASLVAFSMVDKKF
jgi:hypothetical protein